MYNTTDPSCRFCKNHIEKGKHIVLICPYGEDIGQRWNSCKEMDKKKKWFKKLQDGK